MVTLLLAAACGGDAERGQPEAAPAAAPVQTPVVPTPPPPSPLTIAPRSGPPGTEVTLTMSGLIMNARDLQIGFGDFVGHEIIGRADGDAEGRLSTAIAVPAGTPPGTRYFFLAEASGPPLAVSDSFVVTTGP